MRRAGGGGQGPVWEEMRVGGKFGSYLQIGEVLGNVGDWIYTA